MTWLFFSFFSFLLFFFPTLSSFSIDALDTLEFHVISEIKIVNKIRQIFSNILHTIIYD